jgi:hypothetical protein
MYSEKYGEVVFSGELPKTNSINVYFEESGSYRLHLVADRKKCKIDSNGSSCISFNNFVKTKCLVKINGSVADSSICGIGIGDGYAYTMHVADFFIKKSKEIISVEINFISTDDYRPALMITREPPNEFVRWIHPDYGVMSIFVYIIFLLYRIRFFVMGGIFVAVCFFLARRFK